jgi:hypothetical protein
MARNQKEINKIFEKAKEVIAKHNLIFIEEIVSYLPISKPTFYEYFPIGSNEINELKTLLEDNSVSIKSVLRNKWYESDNPTLQIALYRLTSREDEHRKLNQTYTDITSKNEKIDNKFEIEILTNKDEAQQETD